MRVLIVDDSVIFRTGISSALDGQPGIEVVGVAANGKIALDKIKQLKPDVVTMDLEMPVMGGLSAILEIRKTDKDLGILVFTDQSELGAKKAFEALTAGADDFVLKSVTKGDGDSVELIRAELVPKINQFKNRIAKKTTAASKVEVAKTETAKTEATKLEPVRRAKQFRKPSLIVLGCSTGGPEALRGIFSQLKDYKGPPILIVQHMPPVFTAQLARLLTTACGWTVKEAAEGDLIQNNICYVAPGDYHMKLRKGAEGYLIQLNQEEKVKSVRPAVDVLFKSVAENYVGQVLAIVMTGMGEDGLDGVKVLREKEAQIVIQDKQSSVVWGMPGAIFASNAFDSIFALENMADKIKGLI